MSKYPCFLILLAAACGQGAASDGAALYAQPHADGNTFACATCHALEEPAADGFVRPGHPIGDAVARPHYKNGALFSLLDAVNTCRVEWMAASEWTDGDPAWLALEDFLDEQAGSVAAADPIEIRIASPPASLAGGDMETGRELFNHRCVVCHGLNGAGTERGPRIAGLGLDVEYVASRVRTSGTTDSVVYDGLTGGRMPFWGPGRLSDAELLDVVAFVELSEDPGDDNGGGGGGGSDLRACDATHPRVGEVAVLQTRSHGVQGTATIVDDCTVVIEMFSFDGLGIDVRAYGSPDASFTQNGYAMSEDLRRGGGYQDETLTVQLPEDRTLADLGALSIWCVPVGTSFGDGVFRAP